MRYLFTVSICSTSTVSCRLLSSRKDQIGAFEKIEVYFQGEDTLQKAKEILDLLSKINTRADKLTFYQKELGMKLTEFGDIEESLDRFTKIVDIWSALLEWETDSSNWIKASVLDLNASEISNKVSTMKKRIVKSMNYFKDNQEIHKLCMACINAINQFDINYMEMILILRDESFRERHWKELLLHIYKDENYPKLDKLNFKQLIDKNIKTHKSKINQLAEKARNEYIVEYKIEEIQKGMGNSQVALKILPLSKQMVIANSQSLFFAFQENRKKCEDMLKSSEHLETFLKRIYDVYNNIEKLERYFNYILMIQDLLLHTKAIEFMPSVDNELKTKDKTLFRALISKYHNIFDDMKTRGLNMILRQLEDEEERKENVTTEVVAMTEEMYQKLNHPLRYPNHYHAHFFLSFVFSKLKSSTIAAFSLVPRFLNISIEQFCYHVLMTQSIKRLSGLELFFPEVKEFTFSDPGGFNIIGVVFSNTESLTFEKPIPINHSLDDDPLQNYPAKIEELEKVIQMSIKNHICHSFNFFLQNTYNFEKFISFILETKILTQSFETALKAIFVHDISLMLDNPMNTATKDVVKNRLSKYLQLIVNPLRKINAIHFRENVSNGDGDKLLSLESFILILVYHADILKDLMAKNETQYSSFFWQSKLKLSLKVTKEKPSDDLSRQDALESYMKTIAFTLNNIDKFSNLFMISLGTRSLHPDKFSLSVAAFDEAIHYGYQPVACPGKLVFTGQSERCTVNLLLELGKNNIAGIRGHEDSGRRSTVLHLADVTGRYCQGIDVGLLTVPAQLTNCILKSVGCQYWTILENIEDANDDVLIELTKVVLALRKSYVSSGRRFVSIDKIDYLSSSDYALVMLQSQFYTTPQVMSRIPDTVLAEFRCSCFLSVDLTAFIYNQLSELIYFDDFDQKIIATLARQLYFLFQLMHTGLNDKLFITAHLHSEGPPMLEELLCETQTWKATMRTVKPILKKLRTSLRTEHKTLPINRIVYKAIYNTVKFQLNAHQKESLMLNYISIFEPGNDLFRIVDTQMQDTALALYSFLSVNKIPSFSNLGLVEKVQSLSETLNDRDFIAVVNYGSDLQICSQDFNRLQQYIFSLRTGTPSCTGNPL